MTGYGSVPSDEYELDSQAAAQHVDEPSASITKQNAQTYVQVPKDEDDAHSRSVGRKFPELCVSRIVLLALALFFASCALTVGLLYHFSLVNDGLTTQSESNRYAWLYGPTAVVVLARVIWREVDLKTKESTPWQQLADGPAPAEKTIFLEYLSSTPPQKIWKALKFRHWAVAITTTGQLLFLLMLVFITGLFTLETTLIIQHDAPLRRNQMNASVLHADDLGGSPALLNLAIQTQNLSYPRGTSIDTLVPSLDADGHFPANSTTEALVEGIKVSFDCETLDVNNASIAYLPWWSIRAPQFLINVTTPSCNIDNARIGAGPDHGYIQDPTATQNYQGWMRNYACNTGLDYSQPWGERDERDWMNDTTYLHSLNRTLDNRLLISLVDFRYPPTNNTIIPDMWVNRLTALLCKPSYSINEYQVSYSGNSTNTHIEMVKETDATLADFYPADISQSLIKIFSHGQELYISMGGADYQFTSDPTNVFAIMMTLLHGGEQRNFTLKDLVEPDMLESSAMPLLTGIVIQALHQKAMSNTSDIALTGTIAYDKERLHVKALSTGFLCAGFALLSVFTVALFILAPRKYHVESNIESTLTIADILQSNPDLGQLCLSTTAKEAKKAHQSVEYYTREDQASGLRVIEFVKPTDTSGSWPSQTSISDSVKETPQVWWQPAGSRDWYAAVAVALCILIIALLEIVQQLSDKRDGFISIEPSGIGSVILAQYVPAAIVVAVALMFADLEMLTATFSPFATLKKGNATASRTLRLDYLTRSGPHVFLASISNRHFALSIILVTTFIASFLAIVIPGLYSRHVVASQTNTTLIIADHFEFSAADISLDDRRAGANLNLQTYYDVEYPPWIHDDLVFPELVAPAESSEGSPDDSSASTLALRTPAARAKLSCQSLPSKLNWTAPSDAIQSSDEALLRLSARSYLPWSMCSSPPDNVNATDPTPWVEWSFYFNSTVLSSGKHFVGQANVLAWGFDQIYIPKAVNDLGLITGSSQITLPQWGCPSLTFVAGTVTFDVDARNSTSISIVDTDINPLICSQNLQSVEVDLQLEYPSMAIAKDAPPRPDEATTKWLQNSTQENSGTGFQFVPSNMLRAMNYPDGLDSSVWSPSDVPDRFTQAVVYAAQQEDGLTLENLGGVANSDTYLRMVQKLYGRYMAQAISNNMRVSIEEQASNLTLTDGPWTPTASPTIVPTPASTTSRHRSRTTVASAVTQTSDDSKPTSTAEANQKHKRADNIQRTLPATLTRTGASGDVRLKQNRAPKIALQVMLGVMAVGAIASKLLLRTKKTLQREPYSIAGRAVLVANGNMLDASKDGAALRGKRYWLGWWSDGAEARTWGINVER